MMNLVIIKWTTNYTNARNADWNIRKKHGRKNARNGAGNIKVVI